MTVRAMLWPFDLCVLYYPRGPGRGPSTNLAWPGWKQPDIAVDVDRHNSKQAGSKNVV